jgi:site-specific DNA recombinase
MTRKKKNPPAVPTLRCAIYTRKSTDEGLEQDFNSLDAQREAGEAFVRSQQHEGWLCLPARYDDGGFTGANMDRPALRRLLADIEAGKIDCVVVYKVDRLSRSLLDFARLMDAFERHNVSFVSVTQQFNTATSMGRLLLNVLLSFAQFEREMISERTRDKMAAARRKGKWSGGPLILGYNVVDTRLRVDEAEAQRVRGIFELYLERQSLLDVVKELARRDWRTKCWTTRKGTTRGGRPFDKGAIYDLLTNITYVGKVRYKDEIHDGEHEPIVETGAFDKVQTLLRRNGRSGGRPTRNKHNALLRGLLRCVACDCGMSPSYTSKGSRQYRYYVCHRAQKNGWHVCPSPSIPAGEIERFVVDQIKCIGRDPVVIRETLVQARRQAEDQIERLRAERVELHAQLRDDHAQLVTLAAKPGDPGLADAHDRIRNAERRLTEIEDERVALDGALVDESEVTTALGDFHTLWEALAPVEQARVVEMLLDGVAYDGHAGNISITFRPAGIKMLVGEMAARTEDAS